MIRCMGYELLRLLHFAAIFAFTGALFIENMAIKPEITGEDARNLAKVDAVCGASAVLVFLIGMALWLWVGKPSEFYSSNPVFQLKLGLFALLVLLAAYPTVFFARHRQSNASTIAVPGIIRVLLKAEVCVLIVIPVFAFLMARGVGLSG
ncbi:MAG: hypothetical protein COA96_05050 [SAR86 cluster bacterium]|uniref:DUF2214 domain-containing protein n=1 Tax=SAR86 cluster bacterium TaxID=2030880 RepID=A0A2A5B4A9_9GAMM|nr:MAG: hypothetical protein COA96_05050 [SAR86 cluster bacterium]